MLSHWLKSRELQLAVLMSGGVTACVTAMLDFAHTLLPAGAQTPWLLNWAMAWPCGCLLTWLGVPRVNRLLNYLARSR